MAKKNEISNARCLASKSYFWFCYLPHCKGAKCDLVRHRVTPLLLLILLTLFAQLFPVKGRLLVWQSGFPIPVTPNYA
jgi:hypothetical protein